MDAYYRNIKILLTKIYSQNRNFRIPKMVMVRNKAIKKFMNFQSTIIEKMDVKTVWTHQDVE